MHETKEITKSLCETYKIANLSRETEKITKMLLETEEIIAKIYVRQAKLKLQESETAETKFRESCKD